MAEVRINATGGVKLYDADDSHYAQIVAGTITSNVDAITLGHDTVTIADNLSLGSDSAVLKFGADGDTTLTHTDGTGLTLNSTNKLCFNDASQFIQGSSGTVLSIGATDEIDLTATAVDLNGTLNVSGVATFQSNPVFPDGGVAVADLDIDGATDIGAAIVDADLFIVDDGAGGTNRKVTASRLKTYAGGAVTAINNATANELVTIGSTTTELDAESGLTWDGQYFTAEYNANNATQVRVDNDDGGSSAYAGYYINTDGGAAFMFKNSTGRSNDGGTDALNIINESGGVYMAPGATSWSSISDERTKQDIKSITSGLAEINAARPVTYKFIENSTETQVGFIAQELKTAIPLATRGEPAEAFKDADDKWCKLMGVTPDFIIPYLVKAVQELSAEVDTLKTKVTVLEG